MSVKFKLHKDENTVDLSMRISAIANGWVIKAGAAPYFCFTEEEVLNNVSFMLLEYVVQTSQHPIEEKAMRLFAAVLQTFYEENFPRA